VPNLIKTSQKIAEIWHFYGFKNGGHPPSLIFGIQFLTVGEVKFREDRLRRYRDFVIFKMAAAAILDFQKFEIFTVVRHHGFVKFNFF